MNTLEKNELRYRLAMLIVSCTGCLGLFLIIGALFSAETPLTSPSLAEVLFNRSNTLYPITLQNLMWLIFFIGIGEIWVRILRASQEKKQMALSILPERENIMLQPQDLVPIYQQINHQSLSQFYFLQRLCKRIILQFQSNHSASQAHSLMNSSLELIHHEIELKFNMIRYLTWLIPTLGFIGTVVGISFALNAVADMPDVTNSEAIRAWLGALTNDLGLAFNTTLIALIMSVVLVFLMHIAQAKEEAALNNAGQYCLDNLINRLYEK